MRSVGIAMGAITQNIAQYTAFDDKTNAVRGKVVGHINAVQVASRLQGNFNSFIEDHKNGIVDIGKVQAIMADTSALASVAMSGKNLVGEAIFNRTADAITFISLKYPGGKMSTEEFYNLDNWKGFGMDLLENFSREIYDLVPDKYNPWKQNSWNEQFSDKTNLMANLEYNRINLNTELSSISPAQDLAQKLFTAYSSGDKDALSSVVSHHAYTQQRNQEVTEQVQQLKEAEQQRVAEQLAESQQVEQQRHKMVRS